MIKMRLQPKYFDLIKSGAKTYEIRLNDEKRQQIKVGDMIEFENESNQEHFTAVVKKLLHFKSFVEMSKALPRNEFDLNALRQFYTAENEKQYGVVAIKMEVLKANEYKRISIIGPSGSGKSTLAVQLGKLLKLPVFHADKYNDLTEKEKELRIAAETDKWIIDGNVKSTLARRGVRSDLIIYLNFPLEVCKDSILNRGEHLGKPNNPSLSDEEFKQNCLCTIDSWHGKNDEAVAVLFEKHNDKLIELKNRQEVNAFLLRFAKRTATIGPCGSGKKFKQCCVKGEN